jgi:hypothetical protein
MRGFLYSGILVIVVFILFSIMALQKETLSQERESFSLKQEIEGMDSSYRSIERSLHILSDVSMKRAIISSQNSVLNQDSYFAGGKKAPDVLKQLMWNGTIPSNQTAIAFMENNTLEYNIGLLEGYYNSGPKGYSISIYINYSNSTLGIYDSFTLFFNTTAEVNISKPGAANLSRKLNIFEKVSLVGFEDPLYLINVTGGKESRTINRSRFLNNFTQRMNLSVVDGSLSCYGNLTSDISASSKDHKIFFNTTIYPAAVDSFCGVVFVSGDAPNTSYLRVNSVSGIGSLEGQSFLLLGNGEFWGVNDGLFNVSNFISHAHEGGYINSSAGPSFFDMLEGTPGCTYCVTFGHVGLETLIDKNRLSAPELHINVRTGESNAIGEYLQETPGSKFGMNESSVDAGFYEFRLEDSMRNYFK